MRQKRMSQITIVKNETRCSDKGTRKKSILKTKFNLSSIHYA